jgi:hypothetical protein
VSTEADDVPTWTAAATGVSWAATDATTEDPSFVGADGTDVDAEFVVGPALCIVSFVEIGTADS